MPTIKDVAREAGVSIATVSYVINNKDSGVSDSTRQQVLEAIERIGYKPNVNARNLQASQTKLIGYAWHTVRHGEVNPILDRFTYFLAQAAESAGYHMLTFTHNDENWRTVYADLIESRRVDGFILSNTSHNDARIRYLIDSGFPFVSFGRSTPEWDFPYVDTDGTRGVLESVRHLVGLGHRRIAMVAWPADSVSGQHRVQGYLNGLAEAGIRFDPRYVWRGPMAESTGHEALENWLTLPAPEQPTAVIAITDLMAIGVLNAARAAGISVGRDLAVVGYDDVPLAEYLNPPLTTMRQPIAEICQAMIAMLQQIIIGEPPTHRHILLPPQLIIRQSCGSGQ